MQGFVLDPSDPAALARAVGAVICEEVHAGGKRLFAKGHRVTVEDVARLAEAGRTLHAARLDPGDIHEDDAGGRLARAVAAPGLQISEPRQSRVNVIATEKGLLRIDAERLTRINQLPGVLIFSLVNGMSVLPGKILAGAKIAPVAVPAETIEQAEAIAAGAPVIQVKPFRRLRVGVVSTEVLEGRIRERFQESLRKKIGWYGGELLGIQEVENTANDVAAAIEAYAARGADLVLTGGGDTIDPLDAALMAIERIGAKIVRFGAPVHPGSMFWLAYRGDLPIFNLASCSMYSRATSADLILPWIMAGERVTAEDIAELGYGGLLEGRQMSFRFPPYDAEAAVNDEE